MWCVQTAKGSLLHRKDKRILLTLDAPSGSLTWVMAAPFIVSGLAAASGHDQGHRGPICLYPIVLTHTCNSVRRLTVLYPSLELSFQALKSKTDMSKESFHYFMEKRQGSGEAQPSAEGRGLFPPEKGCHAGPGGATGKCFSTRSTWLSPKQTRNHSDHGPERPQCCQGGRHPPFAEQT